MSNAAKSGAMKRSSTHTSMSSTRDNPMSWSVCQLQTNDNAPQPRRRWTSLRPRFTNGNELKSFRDVESTQLRRGRLHILLTSLFIFAVLAGAGLSLYRVYSQVNSRQLYTEALDLAAQTGDWFAKELDLAILPLFSIAQFALELDMFAHLPEHIGLAGAPNALPFVTAADGAENSHRNTTGVCDDPALVAQYVKIASAIKKNSKMEGILNNIQLAPFGVLCLLHPLNNTEDYDNGQFLDRSKAVGLDLLTVPAHKFIAQASIKGDTVAIAGPHPLNQCPSCGNYFIARLPIASDNYTIPIDGIDYPRWGMANVLINWDRLVLRSNVHANFKAQGFEFRLTRTDRPFNETTQTYDEIVVVLAESDKFLEKKKEAFQALQTTNNEWIMTIRYDDPRHYKGLVIVLVLVVAMSIAVLVGVVLLQKQSHSAMMGVAMAQDAKVEVERSMTAYFAHELRNPLSAIDSALQTLPHDEIPYESRSVIAGMQLCSTFMSSIMNNLLDVRKMEEGKLILHADPFSLKQLATNTRQMALPTVSAGVELILDITTADRDWVRGDEPRIQQILTNIVSNAIKYTKYGSVTIAVGWNDLGHVRLECRDTGPGIPKEDQLYLFERFTQRGGAPGSGLGLAIAKQMVTLMAGTIQFDSDPTVQPGTTCIVTLPLELCVEPSEALFEAADDSQPMTDPLSILLVDDITMNRAMLKRRLLKGIAPNCIVTEAVNGEQALATCQDQIFDIIVMDQYMEESGGVMVGTDAIIALRRSHVKSLIVGCSGNDLDDKFRAAGADLVWKKPMPSNLEMIQQLRHGLRQRHSLRAKESALSTVAEP